MELLINLIPPFLCSSLVIADLSYFPNSRLFKPLKIRHLIHYKYSKPTKPTHIDLINLYLKCSAIIDWIFLTRNLSSYIIKEGYIQKKSAAFTHGSRSFPNLHMQKLFTNCLHTPWPAAHPVPIFHAHQLHRFLSHHSLLQIHAETTFHHTLKYTAPNLAGYHPQCGATAILHAHSVTLLPIHANSTSLN